MTIPPQVRPSGRSGGLFFIIGAQRCGTTWLRRALGSHPEIAMAQPEVPEMRVLLQPVEAFKFDAFLERFSPDPAVRRLGEKSTSYLESPRVAAVADRLFEDPRFVVVLRDPAARAVSHYRFTRGHGYEPLPIEEALTEEAENREWPRDLISVSPYHYLRRGRYIDYLRPWMSAVGADRLFVAIFERLLADSRHLDRLEEFLGVTPVVRPLPGIVNPTESGAAPATSDLLETLRREYAAANDELRAFLGDPIDEWP